MNTLNLPETDLTNRFRPLLNEVVDILKKAEGITLKISSLRRFSRNFIRKFIQDLVANIDIDELNNISETEDIKDNIFLKRLDGRLLRLDSPRGILLISTVCPFIHFFDIIPDNGFIMEYEKAFRKEGIIHPLCIIHHIIREELLSRISKGPLYTHPVLIATRDMVKGTRAISGEGKSLLGMKEEELIRLLNEYACIFLIL